MKEAGSRIGGRLALARCWLVCLLALSSPALAFEELWESQAGRERIFGALVGIFRDNYWDPGYRDWDAWGALYREQAVTAGDRSAFDRALSRMVNELSDDHSRWVGLSLPLSLGDETPEPQPGLGFQHSYLRQAGVVIERVFAQTPAAAAGLRRGDVIVRVNGQDVRELPGTLEVDRLLREAVSAGGVQLGLRRQGGFETLHLTPAPVDFVRVSELPQGYMLDDTTGYLYIPSFKPEGTARSVNELLESLAKAGAKALILDLRGNLGGRLGELGLVLGAFIEGTWVEAISQGAVIWRSSYRREADQGINLLETLDGAAFAGDTLRGPVAFTGPLAVLVDRHNSSAGEIAPLVLQELGRATILGEATSGNVEAIQGFNLPDGSLVYVAVANLRGASGLDYSAGVAPDVLVGSSLNDLARGFDAPLAEALKALKALPFTPGKFF